uniref:Cytochrome c oxidase assembly factor 3 n=1 Tax=Angiostrongylus cantonensis TaxID=6313 RepID=A0A0K0CXL6_ANGCA
MLFAAVLRTRNPVFKRLCQHRSLSTVPTNVQSQQSSDMLETIDIEDLPRAQKRFAKQFEKVNEERVRDIFAKNYKNHAALAVLICVVVGIYYYTIHAVKQETFLEEIDEELAAERPETHGHLHIVGK